MDRSRRLTITEAERARVSDLVAGARETHRGMDIETLAAVLAVDAQEMPRRVRECLVDLRGGSAESWCRVSGYQFDQEDLGPTPSNWSRCPQWPAGAAAFVDVLLLLHGCLLGEPFGWATQQGGRLIHNIVPVESESTMQLGSSSTVALQWHTEDAFHPYRADFVLLLCVRNPNAAITTLGQVDRGTLSTEDVDVLFEPRFEILPDESHQVETGDGEEAIAKDKIRKMQNSPDPVSAFSGAREDPYIRVDPPYMRALHRDRRAAIALKRLNEAIDQSLKGIVLEAGDICCIDNHRVVHGREPFRANYDGGDRWLKRLNVTVDLRKSCGVRASEKGRLI